MGMTNLVGSRVQNGLRAMGQAVVCGGLTLGLCCGVGAVSAGDNHVEPTHDSAVQTEQDGAAAVAPTEKAAERPWNQWRGGNRDTSFNALPWPAKLTSDNLKLVWQVPLEPSYSGPITDGKL
jgi:hypothetical protein